MIQRNLSPFSTIFLLQPRWRKSRPTSDPALKLRRDSRRRQRQAGEAVCSQDQVAGISFLSPNPHIVMIINTIITLNMINMINIITRWRPPLALPQPLLSLLDNPPGGEEGADGHGHLKHLQQQQTWRQSSRFLSGLSLRGAIPRDRIASHPSPPKPSLLCLSVFRGRQAAA